jgi:hypothetical protein
VLLMAKLIFIDQNFAGQVYELVPEKTTVGRGDHNSLVIHDHSLSAAHCEILVNGPEVIVRDLGSRNGTLVNGVRLKNQQCQLKHGQTVRFGSVEARLELDAADERCPRITGETAVYWHGHGVGVRSERPAYHGEQSSEISAIYAHRRAMRDLRIAPEPPKPTSVSTHLEPKAHPVAEEQTVLLPLEVLTAPAPTPSAPQNVEPRADIRSKGKFIVIAAVLVLGSMGLLWLVWRAM